MMAQVQVGFMKKKIVVFVCGGIGIGTGGLVEDGQQGIKMLMKQIN